MTLREVPVHTTVKVVKINGEGAFRRRIMDMGITKNSEIYVRKVAPLGDPVEITVRYLSGTGRCGKCRSRYSLMADKCFA